MRPGASERPARPDVTFKVCLAGDPGVGKTSLVRRFLSNTFEGEYIHTLGTKVSSKHIEIEDPDHPGVAMTVGATVWDIMGDPGFRELLKEAFFNNLGALLLVADGTRFETVYLLTEWYDAVRSVCGEVPTVVLINKSDVAALARVEAAAADVCEPIGCHWLVTSAKTGENVEQAFRLVSQLYVTRARAMKGKIDISTERPAVYVTGKVF
ncbi:MAG TPA: Rab family GTPase [Thermoplasmata archaeon]|nr:Rab family GTPase [Thermoplasmata archaeon]